MLCFQLLPNDDEENRQSSEPMMPEVMPMRAQTIHADMKGLKYFCCPIEQARYNIIKGDSKRLDSKYVIKYECSKMVASF